MRSVFRKYIRCYLGKLIFAVVFQLRSCIRPLEFYFPGLDFDFETVRLCYVVRALVHFDHKPDLAYVPPHKRVRAVCKVAHALLVCYLDCIIRVFCVLAAYHFHARRSAVDIFRRAKAQLCYALRYPHYRFFPVAFRIRRQEVVRLLYVYPDYERTRRRRHKLVARDVLEHTLVRTYVVYVRRDLVLYVACQILVGYIVLVVLPVIDACADLNR